MERRVEDAVEARQLAAEREGVHARRRGRKDAEALSVHGRGVGQQVGQTELGLVVVVNVRVDAAALFDAVDGDGLDLVVAQAVRFDHDLVEELGKEAAAVAGRAVDAGLGRQVEAEPARDDLRAEERDGGRLAAVGVAPSVGEDRGRVSRARGEEEEEEDRDAEDHISISKPHFRARVIRRLLEPIPLTSRGSSWSFSRRSRENGLLRFL